MTNYPPETLTINEVTAELFVERSNSLIVNYTRLLNNQAIHPLSKEHNVSMLFTISRDEIVTTFDVLSRRDAIADKSQTLEERIKALEERVMSLELKLSNTEKPSLSTTSTSLCITLL